MKKVFRFIIILACLLSLTASAALALVPEDSFEDALVKPQWNKQSFDFNTINNIAQSLTVSIAGSTDKDLNEKLGNNAVGAMSNLIGFFYTQRPASSVDYFADLSRNLKVVKPAYAQGIGFEGLSMVLDVWKAFRNIAYFFFTIVFVVIGFAIMFRVKLNPQTVISIQNALPRIIIALILVTFSYAIAGFLIDLIYILINLVVLVIAPIGGLDVTEQQQKFATLNFGEGLGLLLGGAGRAIWKTPAAITTAVISTLLSGIIGFLTLGPWGAAAVVIPALIIAIIALFAIFRLFISLLLCYINIILSIIFAPIQIMLGAIPGFQMGFSSWLKNLIANILVFPAVALFLLLGWILTGQEGPGWTPPMLFSSGQSFVAIIGFGMLLMAPKIPEMVKKALQIEPSPFGGAIGEALGPVKAPLGLGRQGAAAYTQYQAGQFAKARQQKGSFWRAFFEYAQRQKWV